MLSEFLRVTPESENGLSWIKSPANCVKLWDTPGRLTEDGYWQFQLRGKYYYVHRVVWELINGPIPEGFEVDHRDGNTLNNRPENLRLATDAGNSQNRKTPTTNKSGVKGVSWAKDRSKWAAQCMTNGKNKHLGFFTNLEDAARAVQDWRESVHAEFHNHG